jgi:hypothetical protein
MVKYWARKGGLSTPVVSALPASDARLAQTPRTQAAADRLPARLCGMAPSADRHASPLIRRLAPGKGFPERKAALTAARSNTPAQCPRWVKRVAFAMSAVCLIYPQHQTFPGPIGTSHLGHRRTSFENHFGLYDNQRRYFEPENASSLERFASVWPKFGCVSPSPRPSRLRAPYRSAPRAATRSTGCRGRLRCQRNGRCPA